MEANDGRLAATKMEIGRAPLDDGTQQTVKARPRLFAALKTGNLVGVASVAAVRSAAVP